MPGKYHDIATRAQALTLKVIKYLDAENTKITGLPRSTINSIYRTARARGYNPDACQTLFNSYIEDAPKPGPPYGGTASMFCPLFSLALFSGLVIATTTT